VEQCRKPEFYSNIRQHTDLCESVYANYRASPFLVALNAMAVNTYACGTRPCTEMLQGLFVRMGWQTVGVVVLLLLFAPNLLVCLYKAACCRSLSADEMAIFRQTESHAYAPYFQDLQQNYSCLDAGLPSGLRSRKTLGLNEVKMV
jgi:hypothetical protein